MKRFVVKWDSYDAETDEKINVRTGKASFNTFVEAKEFYNLKKGCTKERALANIKKYFSENRWIPLLFACYNKVWIEEKISTLSIKYKSIRINI